MRFIAEMLGASPKPPAAPVPAPPSPATPNAQLLSLADAALVQLRGRATRAQLIATLEALRKGLL